MVSWGVRIADNKEVKSGARITRAKRKLIEESDDDEPEPVPSDSAVVGAGGEGYGLEDDDDSDDEASVFHSNLIYSTAHLNISSESISTISSEVSAATPTESRSRHSSFTQSITSDDGEPSSHANEAFHHAAVAGLLDALTDTKPDFSSGTGTRLEFTGLRLSMDATDRQIRRSIATAFTKRISQLVEGGKSASESATSTFATPGVVDFLNEVALGKPKIEDAEQVDAPKLEDDSVDFIFALQRDLVHRVSGAAILAAVCQRLYMVDVLKEEAFTRWWAESEGLESEDGEMKRVRGPTKVFVDWLEAASEEESDSEDESDEESE